MFDGLEIGLFPIAARPALIDLMNGPSEAVVGEWYSYLVALFLVGAAAGGFLFGWMGDKIGRVRSMALSIAAYSLFTGAAYFATEPWHLGACRFLAALGMGGEWALGVALVMECWPEKFRPLLAGVIGAAANFGFLGISVIGIWFHVTVESWRWIMLAGAGPGLLAFFIIAFIPESKRWQESVKTAAVRPFREIFTTRLAVPTLLGIAFASVALIGTWGAVSGFLPPWTDQLAGGDATLRVQLAAKDSPGGIERTTIESVAEVRIASDQKNPEDYRAKKTHDLERSVQPGERFAYKLTISNLGSERGTGVQVIDRVPIDRIEASSFRAEGPGDVAFDPDTGELLWKIGDLEYKDPGAKAWIQFVLSIGAILGCFVGPLLGNRLGRRPAYFLLCLLSLVFSAILFRGMDEYNALFIALAGIVGMVTASFYGWLPLYLPEIFPTRVRATGQGIAYNAGRLLAAAGALTTGKLMSAFDGSYPQACATITLVYIVGMVLIWLAPETKGKPLPE
jgi:MFS family permease